MVLNLETIIGFFLRSARRQAHARTRSGPAARLLMHQTALIGNDYSSLCKLKCNKGDSLRRAEQARRSPRPRSCQGNTSARECDPARACERLIALLGIFSRGATHQNRAARGTREPSLDEGGRIPIPVGRNRCREQLFSAAPHLGDARSSRLRRDQQGSGAIPRRCQAVSGGMSRRGTMWAGRSLFL